MQTRGTVLLIEDEEAIADLVRMYFEQDGFRLVHAGDGAAGLNAVRDRSPRVLGYPGIEEMPLGLAGELVWPVVRRR